MSFSWSIEIDIKSGEIALDLTFLIDVDEIYSTLMLEIDMGHFYILGEHLIRSFSRGTYELISSIEFLPGGVGATGGIGDVALSKGSFWIWYKPSSIQSSYGRSSSDPSQLIKFDAETGERSFVMENFPSEYNIDWVLAYGPLVELLYDNDQLIMMWKRGFYTIVDTAMGTTTTEPSPLIFINIMGGFLCLIIIMRFKTGLYKRNLYRRGF